MLLLRRPAKKGSETAFQSRKAPRALGSVVCRKWDGRGSMEKAVRTARHQDLL